jgi:hypothetical protein
LLDLEHPQIPLRLVVVKGNGEVVQKGEDLILPQPEPFEQVARRRLFESTLVVQGTGRRRIGGVAGRQELSLDRHLKPYHPGQDLAEKNWTEIATAYRDMFEGRATFVSFMSRPIWRGIT